MKKAILSLFFTALVSLTVANAMDWRYGILASYDNTELDNIEGNTSSSSGFSVGAMVGYDFIDYFAIQSGLHFSMVNLNSADRYLGDYLDLILHENIRLYYLSIPLLVQGKLPVGNVDLILEAGPQFYCGVGSYVNATLDDFHTDDNYIDRYESDTDIDAFDYLQRFNCMIHVGIGAEYSGARLMVGYNVGIYNIAKSEDQGNLKTRGFQITAGYIF